MMNDNIDYVINANSLSLGFEYHYCIGGYITFAVIIKISDFSGRGIFWLDLDTFKIHADTLACANFSPTQAYLIQNGDSDDFISLQIETNGVLVISGELGEIPRETVLKFSTQVDTALPSRIASVFREYIAISNFPEL